MVVCCCSLAGTAACQHCSANPFATDLWTNKIVTADHIEAKPFGDGLDVCPVCGKPSTIGKKQIEADRIRAMTDEELANFISLCCGWTCAECPVSKECDGDKCFGTWLKWLKQEVENEL